MKILVVLLWLFTLPSFSQINEKDECNKTIYEMANSAVEVSQMTEAKKQVVYYFNIAIMNPSLFKKKIFDNT